MRDSGLQCKSLGQVIARRSGRFRNSPLRKLERLPPPTKSAAPWSADVKSRLKVLNFLGK
jgi:hypothetical protein